MTRPMSVEQLIDRLRELPGHYPVMVEVIVGGDLVTDDVDLADVKVLGHHSAYVSLVPDAADHYDTRALIDEGLAARAAEDERAAASVGNVIVGPRP